MKKLISFLALSFCALIVNAQATHNMKITFQDGNTVVYGMENVKSVEFVEKEDPSAKETYTIAGVEYPMPEAVDLGLPSGTKWASMNIGAKGVYEIGGYYGWADPTGELTSNSYCWLDTSINGPWTSDLFGGTNPPKDISGTDLDLSTRKLGKEWRMPSPSDFRELNENCTFKKYEKYYEVIGPNGASIILPISGQWCFSKSDSSGNPLEYYKFVLVMDYTPCFWTSTRSFDDSYLEYDAEYNYPAADYTHVCEDKFWGMVNGICDSYYRNAMMPIRAIKK